MRRWALAVLLILGLSLIAAPQAFWLSGSSERLHMQVSVQTELEQFETRKMEGFDWISLPECSFISMQGHPALPIKSVVMELPRNSEIVKISVVKSNSVVVPGKYLVAPAPKPVATSKTLEREVTDENSKLDVLDGDSLFSSPKSEIYDSSVPYPTKLFDSYCSKGRKQNYVMIYFYPVKFTPLEGRLTLVTEAVFDVEFAVEAESTAVDNEPSLDQVIITAPAYVTEANSLAVWRNKTQVRTAVYTTDWIYSTYGGVDQPEKIRNFIGDLFDDTGIRYVVLFGDVDAVPTRFAYVPDGDDAGAPDGILVPTDYYYECLDGTWDTNGDGKYADLQNDDFTQVDFIPEVSLGRLSVNTTTAGYVVNKIIDYEENIDPTWSKKMVLAGTDLNKDFAGAEGELVNDYAKDVVQGNFTEFTRLYETLGTLSTSNISDQINLGCGGFNFAGHGNYGLWSLEDAGLYTNTHAANLINGNKLPIVTTMACLSAGFDSMYNTGNCLGEEFLRNPNGGSAAFMGATRTAWFYLGFGVTSGLGGELDWRLWESYKRGITQPGPMLTEAKIRYISRHPLNTLHDGNYYKDEKTVLEFALIGDPVLFNEKPYASVKTFKDQAYSKEVKFFTVNEPIYIEADVRGYGDANVSSANVYAAFYADGSLEANITLAHLGDGSSLYRGSWSSNSYSSIGVYTINITAVAQSPYESICGNSSFHLYSGVDVSAYQMDWNEDDRDDYILENEHLVSVFDGTQNTSQLIANLYQKDTETSYTFRSISDPDSIGRGEVTTSNMKENKLYSFNFPQNGENLASASLNINTRLRLINILIIDDDGALGGTDSAARFNAVLSSLGYNTTLESSASTNPATWTNYDLMVWAASDDTSPINGRSITVRDALVDYVSGGGRLIIEGGEIGYVATYYNWNSFLNNVLHVWDMYFGDMPSNVELELRAATHPIATAPNTLPSTMYFTYDGGYGSADWLTPLSDAELIYQWDGYVSTESQNYGNPLGGIIAHDDDDDAINGGQIVFLSLDLLDIDNAADEQNLIENMVNWVTPIDPKIATSFNITIEMRSGSVDYLVYKLNNFDENISYFSDVFSDITGTLGSSVEDDRYHLENGMDGLITSLSADQWSNYAFSDYVCVYDNSTSDSVNDVVLAWVRFNETATVSYIDVGLWNDSSHATEGARIRYNASQASADDEVIYMLVFTKGTWQSIHEWMPTIGAGQYPDPNFAKFPPSAVYLLLTVDPSQSTYPIGQTATFTVNVFNNRNYGLDTTLTLTVTGPSDYYYYDFQNINVAADIVGEYSFSWDVPDVAGSYVVEASLVPPQLTAYDAVWLEAV